MDNPTLSATHLFGKTFHLLLFLTVLAGCTSTVHMAPPLSEDNPPAPDQGVVVVRVVDASAGRLPFNFLTLAPKELNQSEEIKPYRLPSVKEHAGDSVLFASSIPEGDYSLSRLSAFYIRGETYYGRGAEADVELGTFSVAPGEVTDLGTIIYYPKVQEDKYLDTLLRVPESSSLPLARERVNTEIPHAGSVSRWHEDGKTSDRFSDYAAAVQNPVAFNDRLLGSDGTLYFYGKLGTILIRSPEGNWDMDAVEADADMHAMAVNTRGDKIIGGDSGRLFYKAHNGEWEDLSLDKRLSIQDLSFQDERTVTVIAKDYYDIEVRRLSLDGNKKTWEELARYNAREGWVYDREEPTGLGITRRHAPTLEPIGNVYTQEHNGRKRLILTTRGRNNHSIFAPHNTHFFNLEEADWRLSASDGYSSGIDGIMKAGEVVLGFKKAGYFSLSGKPSYHRYDQASNRWEEVDTHFDECPQQQDTRDHCYIDDKTYLRYRDFVFTSTPVFTSPTDGYAITRYETASSDSPQRTLAITDDGGKTWSRLKAQPPREYCTTLVPEVTDRLLVYCNGASSDFFESTDRGETWQHVREHRQF